MKPLIYFTIPLSYGILLMEIILYVMPMAIYWPDTTTVNAIAYCIFALFLHVITVAGTSIFNWYLYKLWRYGEISSFTYTLFLLIIINITSLVCYTWLMQSLDVVNWLLILLVLAVGGLMVFSNVVLIVTKQRITNQWMTPQAETTKEPIEVRADEW